MVHYAPIRRFWCDKCSYCVSGADMEIRYTGHSLRKDLLPCVTYPLGSILWKNQGRTLRLQNESGFVNIVTILNLIGKDNVRVLLSNLFCESKVRTY